MALLSVENLTLYPISERERGGGSRSLQDGFPATGVVEGVSFSVEPGTTLGLVGEEGSGKAALAEALLFLRPIEGGRMIFTDVEVTALNSRQIRRIRKQIQGVFSDDFGQLTAEFTVDQMFREVLEFWYPRESAEDWTHRIEKVMVACGLPEAVRVLYPLELDAVERQEVALARALLLEPRLLVLNGFTRRLDAVQEAELLGRIREVKEVFSLSLIVLTDDLAVARQLSDDIGVLHRGRLVELSPARELVEQPVHDYTKRLVSFSL